MNDHERPTATTMALDANSHNTAEPTLVREPSAICTIQPEYTCNGLCLAHGVSTCPLTASNGLQA